MRIAIREKQVFILKQGLKNPSYSYSATWPKYESAKQNEGVKNLASGQ